jgi:hypothetical protein
MTYDFAIPNFMRTDLSDDILDKGHVFCQLRNAREICPHAWYLGVVGLVGRLIRSISTLKLLLYAPMSIDVAHYK